MKPLAIETWQDISAESGATQSLGLATQPPTPIHSPYGVRFSRIIVVAQMKETKMNNDENWQLRDFLIDRMRNVGIEPDLRKTSVGVLLVLVSGSAKEENQQRVGYLTAKEICAEIVENAESITEIMGGAALRIDEAECEKILCELERNGFVSAGNRYNFARGGIRHKISKDIIKEWKIHVNFSQ